MGIFAHIQMVGTVGMTLQQTNDPVGYRVCQTMFQRAKAINVELVKPVEKITNGRVC